jgi:hypothetical protein
MSSVLTVELNRLTPAQEKIRAEAARLNCVSCGRRFGKSTLGIDLAIDVALDGYPVGWFAPEYRLLTEAWRDMEAILGPAAKANKQERRLELVTGGVIECWAFDRNPNAGRSRKYKRIIVDEAAHCTSLESLWQKCLRPTLTDFAGDAYFLSSPNGTNYFKRLFERGERREGGWRAWRFTTYDNPLLDRAEIDAAKAELPEAIFRQEYLAEFVEDATGQLIQGWWLDRAANESVAATVAELRTRGRGKTRRLAVDLSVGSGRDSTTVCVRDAVGILAWHESAYTGLAEAAKVVADLSREWNVAQDSILFDAAGIGRDFPKHLEQYRIDAVPYFGGANLSGRFKNRRSRSAWNLRQRLDPDRPATLPPDPDPPKSIWEHEKPRPRTRPQDPFHIPAHLLTAELREELLALRWTLERDVTALESKDVLMERLGRSPDRADALVMSFALEDE